MFRTPKSATQQKPDQGTRVDNTTFNFNFKELTVRIKEPQRLNCPRLVGVQ